jgi:3D (Asp-Asp-Asp) domain-containing protein
MRPAAVVVSALLLLCCHAGQAADSMPKLQANGHDLAARAHAALLELYALDSRVERARARLDALRAHAAELALERATALRELAAARRTVSMAQTQLAIQLRALYEHEQPSFVSVLLSAGSLDVAVQAFDDLTRAAGSTGFVLQQAQTAAGDVARLSRRLRARTSQIARLERRAAANETALERAQADRQGLINRLRSQQELNAEQIAQVQSQAGAAVATAHTATLEATTTASAVSCGAQAPLLTNPAAGPGSASPTLIVSSTGYSLPGSTAIGLPVARGIVAVDPTVIPLGTRLTIPGYGEGIAADTGSAVRGYDIDLWFPTLKEARAWGRQTVTVTLH